jgi:hypothetical protein
MAVVTFHWKGLLAFLAFAAILAMATDSRLGLIAMGAAVVVEALMWSGVLGFGRGGREERPGRSQ